LTAACSAIIWFAVGAEPRKDALAAGSLALLVSWIGTLLLLLVVTVAMVLSWSAQGEPATARPDEFVRLVLAASSALLLVAGNYLPKTRANFSLGVRTPWTLSSPITWQKTHRLAGPLFMAAGALGLLGAAVAPVDLLVGGFLLQSVGAGLIPAAYSWFVWRTAPDRQQAG
jgi:uncharacterized membrane protein